MSNQKQICLGNQVNWTRQWEDEYIEIQSHWSWIASFSFTFFFSFVTLHWETLGRRQACRDVWPDNISEKVKHLNFNTKLTIPVIYKCNILDFYQFSYVVN